MNAVNAASPAPAPASTAAAPVRDLEEIHEQVGPPNWRRLRGGPSRTSRGLPYALLIPALAVMIGVLGYPVYYLIRISFQDFGTRQLFNPDAVPEWVGLDNYTTFFSSDDFVPVVIRTLLFTTACVGLTILIGLGIALLMQRLSNWVRLPLLVAMMFAWAMPFVSAIAIFRWLFDFQYGVVNYLISLLPGVDFTRHHWFLEPVQGFGVVTAMIVWQAIPFVAVTLYAGLTQVPQELIEAARIDGAGRWALFRNVIYPVLKPVLTIVTALSIIWDFQVVIHLLAMLSGTPNEDYYTLPLYSYMISFATRDFGLGAAAAVITVAALIAVTLVYIRQILRIQEAD
ncbi:MAG: sugar ABC transporter permease [Sporichthyaceae bacterium]|nr:sugar ABC transporter permease [Sporichthyaceae bacterium]